MNTGSTSALLVFATPSFDEKGPDELLVGDCCAADSFDNDATQLKNGALRRTHPYTYRFAAASSRISANNNNKNNKDNNNNNNDSFSRTPRIIATNTRAQQQRGAIPHPNALTARPPPPSTAVSSSRRNTFVVSTSTRTHPPSSATRSTAPPLREEEEEDQRERGNKTLANRTAVQHYPLLRSPSWPPQGEHAMPQFFHQNDQPHFMKDSVVGVTAGCRTAVGSHHMNKSMSNRFNLYDNNVSDAYSSFTTVPTTGSRGEQMSAMRGDAGIGSSTSSIHNINNNIICGNSCKNNSATTLLHTAISQLRAAGALPFVVDVEAFHGQEEAPEENGFSKSLMVDSPTSVAMCKTSLRSSSSSAAAVTAAVTAARRSIALKNLERDLLSGKWSGADTAAAVTGFPENGYRQQHQREKDCQAGGADVSSESGSGGLVGCVNLHINVGEFLRTYIHLHEGLREEEDGGDGRRNLYKKNETFQQQGYQQAPPSPQNHQKKREKQNPQQRDEDLIDGDSDVDFSLANCSLLDLIFRAIKKFELTEQQQRLFSNSHSAFQNEGYSERNKERHHKNGGANERALEFENKIKTVVDAVSMIKSGLAATSPRKGVGGHYGQTIIAIPILSVMGENESKQRNTQTGNLGLTHRFSNVNNDYLLSSSSSSVQQYQSGHPSSSSSPLFYSLNVSSSRGGPYAAPSFASSFISGAAGEFTTPTGMSVKRGQKGERWGTMTMTANTTGTPRPPAPPTVTTNNKNKKAAIANPNQQITVFGNRQVLYNEVERDRPPLLLTTMENAQPLKNSEQLIALIATKTTTTTMEKENKRGGIRANSSASSRLFRFPRINECVRLLSFSSSAHASPSYMYSNLAVPTAATTTANAQTTAALSSHRLFPHSSSAVLPPPPPPPPPQPILVLCIAQSPSLLLSSSRDEDEEITSNPWEPTYLSNHCSFRLYAAAADDDYEDCPHPQHVSSHQNQERPPRFFGSTQRSSNSSSASSSSSLQKWKRFGGDAVENLFAYCSTNKSKYDEGGSTNSGVGPLDEEREEVPVRFPTPRLGGNSHDDNNYNINSFDSNPHYQHLHTSSPAPSNNNEHRNNPLLLSSTSNHSDLMFIEACRRRDAFYGSVGKAFSRVLLLTLQSRGEQHKRRRKAMMNQENSMMAMMIKDKDQESSDVKRVVRPHEHRTLRVSSGGPKAVPPSPPTPPPTRARGHYTHPFAKNEDVSLHASRPVRQREPKEKEVESDDNSIFSPSPWAHVPRYSGPFDAHIGIGGSIRDNEASLSDPCDGFIRWDWQAFYHQLMDGLCLSVSHDLVRN